MSDIVIELSNDEYDKIPFIDNSVPFVYPTREYHIVDGDEIPLSKDSIPLYIVHPSKRKKREKKDLKIIILSPKSARFIHEGTMLYKHMIHDYDTMIYDSYIPHFYIHSDGRCIYEYDVYKLNEDHGQELEQSIIPWIHTEKKSGRLFNKNHWKAFQSEKEYNNMYYGYRVLFIFKQIYFQLTIEDECDMWLCVTNHSQDECLVTHFSVLLYGWMTEYIDNTNKSCTVTENNWIPSKEWGSIYYNTNHVPV